MYNEKEKQTAQAILSNEDFTELIAKVFLEVEDKLTSDVVNSHSDKALGEIVRANDLAEQKIKTRFNRLKMLAQEKQGKPNPAAKK